MIAFLILGALLVCALLFVLIRGRLRLRGAAFALALAAAAAAVALAGIGVKQGLVFCRYASAPEETVEAFFDDLEAARYDEACALLGNYADLGLSGRPEDPAAAELCDALRASYSGRLVGQADTEGLAAVQRVEFTALDVSALQSELRGVVLERLAEIVDSRSYDEVYDEQNQYRPEIAEEAYRLAVSELLARADDFARTETLSVSLSYDESGWHILADAALLSALNGYITH